MDRNDQEQLKIMNYYKENRESYRKLGKRLEKYIKLQFEKNRISYHSIESRAKSRESFFKKLQRKEYNSLESATDLCGIRVITFLESETKIVEKFLRSLFVIDEERSMDKSENLGEDRVGYKSIHLVASLPEELLRLQEFERFRGMKFEIQVRTILQHAWAEVEHDKNYKFSGQLPPDIKRRFKLLAGFLEIADREFENISKEITEYEKRITSEIADNRLQEIELNSTSLRKYLNEKLKLSVKQAISQKTIKFLADHGIKNLKDFSGIENSEIIKLYTDTKNPRGLIAYDLMIRHLVGESQNKEEF